MHFKQGDIVKFNDTNLLYYNTHFPSAQDNIFTVAKIDAYDEERYDLISFVGFSTATYAYRLELLGDSTQGSHYRICAKVKQMNERRINHGYQF